MSIRACRCDPPNEPIVGRHDPRSQPAPPDIGSEPWGELPDGELVGVDGFSIEGISGFVKGDEVDPNPRRGEFMVRVNVIGCRVSRLVLLDLLGNARIGAGTLRAHGWLTWMTR